MKNFVIVGTQRTGSGAISEALGRHPLIACGWEWTQRVPWTAKLSVAEQALGGDFSVLSAKHQEHMRSVFRADKEWLGFRRLFRASALWAIHPRFSPVLLLDRLEGHISWIAWQPELRVIHLVRRDGIAWLKSKYLARKTGTYSGKAYPAGTVVRIPVRRAVARLRAKAWVDHRLATLDVTNPYIRIAYEDFANDPRGAVGDALRFLGCDPEALPEVHDIKPRQSTAPTAQYLANHGELLSALSQRGLVES